MSHHTKQRYSFMWEYLCIFALRLPKPKYICMKRIKGDTMVPLIAPQATLVPLIKRPKVPEGGGKTEPPSDLALLGSFNQEKLGRHFGSHLGLIMTCSNSPESSICGRGDLPVPATSVSNTQLCRQ